MVFLFFIFDPMLFFYYFCYDCGSILFCSSCRCVFCFYCYCTFFLYILYTFLSMVSFLFNVMFSFYLFCFLIFYRKWFVCGEFSSFFFFQNQRVDPFFFRYKRFFLYNSFVTYFYRDVVVFGYFQEQFSVLFKSKSLVVRLLYPECQSRFFSLNQLWFFHDYLIDSYPFGSTYSFFSSTSDSGLVLHYRFTSNLWYDYDLGIEVHSSYSSSTCNSSVSFNCARPVYINTGHILLDYIYSGSNLKGFSYFDFFFCDPFNSFLCFQTYFVPVDRYSHFGLEVSDLMDNNVEVNVCRSFYFFVPFCFSGRIDCETFISLDSGSFDSGSITFLSSRFFPMVFSSFFVSSVDFNYLPRFHIRFFCTYFLNFFFIISFFIFRFFVPAFVNYFRLSNLFDSIRAFDIFFKIYRRFINRSHVLSYLAGYSRIKWFFVNNFSYFFNFYSFFVIHIDFYPFNDSFYYLLRYIRRSYRRPYSVFDYIFIYFLLMLFPRPISFVFFYFFYSILDLFRLCGCIVSMVFILFYLVIEYSVRWGFFFFLFFRFFTFFFIFFFDFFFFSFPLLSVYFDGFRLFFFSLIFVYLVVLICHS